jgi:hypothetical protein
MGYTPTPLWVIVLPPKNMREITQSLISPVISSPKNAQSMANKWHPLKASQKTSDKPNARIKLRDLNLDGK